jgi:hypothetical protein
MEHRWPLRIGLAGAGRFQMEEQMRALVLTLAAAACLGLAAPVAAETRLMGPAGPYGVSADMLANAQFASSEKKKGKKKSMSSRTSWGG